MKRLLIAALLVVTGCGGASGMVRAVREGPASTPLPPVDNPLRVRVVSEVVDGDTIYVEGEGTSIRLVQFDTPETKDPTPHPAMVLPGSKVECYGEVATKRMRELLPEGSQVVLTAAVGVKDKATGKPTDRDQHGRSLAYVSLPNGVDPGRVLIDEGLARWTYISPNRERLADYQQAEAHARARNVGLWSACKGATEWAADNWGRPKQ